MLQHLNAKDIMAHYGAGDVCLVSTFAPIRSFELFVYWEMFHVTCQVRVIVHSVYTKKLYNMLSVSTI